MKKQIVFLLAFGALLSGCCTKKACADWPLPVITIHFTGADTDDRYTLFTLKQNVVTDSVQQAATIDCELTPFTGYNMESGEGISFIISHKGKKETISNFTALFEKKEATCNKCFLFFKDKETVNSVSNFGYQHNSVNKSEPVLNVDF